MLLCFAFRFEICETNTAIVWELFIASIQVCLIEPGFFATSLLEAGGANGAADTKSNVDADVRMDIYLPLCAMMSSIERICFAGSERLW